MLPFDGTTVNDRLSLWRGAQDIARIEEERRRREKEEADLRRVKAALAAEDATRQRQLQRAQEAAMAIGAHRLEVEGQREGDGGNLLERAKGGLGDLAGGALNWAKDNPAAVLGGALGVQVERGLRWVAPPVGKGLELFQEYAVEPEAGRMIRFGSGIKERNIGRMGEAFAMTPPEGQRAYHEAPLPAQIATSILADPTTYIGVGALKAPATRAAAYAAKQTTKAAKAYAAASKFTHTPLGVPLRGAAGKQAAEELIETGRHANLAEAVAIRDGMPIEEQGSMAWDKANERVIQELDIGRVTEKVFRATDATTVEQLEAAAQIGADFEERTLAAGGGMGRVAKAKVGAEGIPEMHPPVVGSTEIRENLPLDAMKRGNRLGYRVVTHPGAAADIVAAIETGNPSAGFRAAIDLTEHNKATLAKIAAAEKRGAIPVFTSPDPTVSGMYATWEGKRAPNILFVAIEYSPEGLIYESPTVAKTQSRAWAAMFQDTERVIDARSIKQVYILSKAEKARVGEYYQLFETGFRKGKLPNVYTDIDPERMAMHAEASRNLLPPRTTAKSAFNKPTRLSNGLTVKRGSRVRLLDGSKVTLTDGWETGNVGYRFTAGMRSLTEWDITAVWNKKTGKWIERSADWPGTAGADQLEADVLKWRSADDLAEEGYPFGTGMEHPAGVLPYEIDEGPRAMARLGKTPPEDYRAAEGPLAEKIIPDVGAEAAGVASPVGEAPASKNYAAPLRPFSEVADEVVTSENPVVQALVGRTGINPAILQTSKVGKGLIAHDRQVIAAGELTDTALAASLDKYVQPFTGRRVVFKLDDIGKVKNLTAPEGKSLMWNDVFSRPGDYALSTKQQGLVDDYLDVIENVERLRVDAGLEARSLTGEEGWFYVPRQVKGIRGVELQRPSSAKLQRLYEEAQDGVAKGINYSDDPRAVLDLHVRAAYKEIIDKQLADYLQPISLGAKDLVPKAVVKRMVDANKLKLAAELAGRKLQRQALKKLGKAPEGLRRGQGAALKAKIITNKAEVKSLTAAYRKERQAYTKALASAHRAEVGPGKFWGADQPDEIAIGSWHTRFFPREDADKLTAALGTYLKPPESAGLLQPFKTTGDVVRFLAAVGDFAMPFIQGLPLLARNPVAWSRATARHYQAFLDPTVQARYISNHLETFQKMSQHGIPIGDPEFFAAMRQGDLPSKPGEVLEQLLGRNARHRAQNIGKQTFGRFQATYNTGLGVSRAQIWEALEPGWKGTQGELARYVRNMTGGLDARSLGVGPGQLAVESTWGAFSPRLLRSTAALAVDAMKGPLDPVGRESIRTLLSMAAGVTGVYALTGKALGKTDAEIKTGLNPLEGKKFLAHQIGGDWIGIGGQVRAITQLCASLATSPLDVVKTNVYDNPLIAFYSSRGAPGMRIAGGLAEAFTGGTTDFLPYEVVDSPIDFVKLTATSALPFVVQGILEGEQALTAGASEVGFRTQAESRTERRNRVATEEYKAPYDDLSPQQQDDFRKAHPDLYSQVEDYPEGSPAGRVIELSAEKTDRMSAIGDRLRQDNNGEAYINARSDILTDIAIRQDELGRDYEPRTDLQRALAEWNKMIVDAKELAVGGVLDGKAFGKLEDQAEKTMGKDRWALVQSSRMASADPVEKEYLQARAKMAPYWDAQDRAWQKRVLDNPSARADMRRYSTYQEYEDSVVSRLAAQGKSAEYATLDRGIKWFTQQTGGAQTRFLRENPEVDALLAYWYGRNTHSARASAIYKKRWGMAPRPVGITSGRSSGSPGLGGLGPGSRGSPGSQ